MFQLKSVITAVLRAPSLSQWQTFLLRSCAALLLVACSIASAPAQDAEAPRPPKTTIQKIEATLLDRTSFEVENVPLRDVLKRLSVQHRLHIRIDEAGLKQAGVSPETPITMSIKNFTLNAVLLRLLENRRLHYIVDVGDASLLVTAAPPEAVRPKAVPAAERVAAPRRAPVAANRAGMALPNAAAFQKRFEQEFRSVLMVELRFLRAVCQATQAQLAQLQNDSAKLLEEASRQQVELLGVQPGDKRLGQAPPDARQLVVDSLLAYIEQEYPAEVVARYRREVAKRAAFQQQASLHMIVASMDQELLLSADQRRALHEALTDWQIDAPGVLAAYAAGANGLPQIPERLLAKILDEAQLRIWHEHPKQVREIQWGQAVRFLGFPPNDLADEAGPQAVKPPEGGPRR